MIIKKSNKKSNKIIKIIKVIKIIIIKKIKRLFACGSTHLLFAHVKKGLSHDVDHIKWKFSSRALGRILINYSSHDF